jgi:hypothetical protein
MHNILIHPSVLTRLSKYLDDLKAGDNPGFYLQKRLEQLNPQWPGPLGLLDLLINTKQPQIFAESAVRGDGSDWNARELAILGDVSIVTPVMVFDDGRHTAPHVHEAPFQATLIFTAGALLRNGFGLTPADWDEVTRQERIDQEAYNALYERRLLPVFSYVNEIAAAAGRSAVITVPGLGCGQFAGPFRGQLGEYLREALTSLLERHGASWPHIAIVWFDPYSQCHTDTQPIHHLRFKVRPLMHGHADTPQLCPPEAYLEGETAERPLCLFSIVAWDHVSWPGNDFYAGARATDDGVKAAATSSMQCMTGLEGRYDPQSHVYNPPEGYRCWDEVVRRNELRIRVGENLRILPAD